MTTSIDTLFDGYEIDMDLPAIRLTPYQAEVVRKAVAETPTQKLRYTCLVAEALNEALNGGLPGTPFEEYGDYEIAGQAYRLNPKGRSQFGMDQHGKPYLTTSLINIDTGVRYKFTWRGDSVDERLKVLAVNHDEGNNTRRTRIALSLDAAEKHIIGEKTPGAAERAKRDRRRNHGVGPDGNPYPRPERRDHNRICRADLA